MRPIQENAPTMPRYVLKFLVDVEARDDLDARQQAVRTVQETASGMPGLREIVLHAVEDHKSIRINPDGTFHGQWNKGGPSAPPMVAPSGR